MEATLTGAIGDRPGVAVRPLGQRDGARGRAPAVLVPGRGGGHLGRGAPDGARDDRGDPRRRRHDEREPLDRARPGAARAPALCRQPEPACTIGDVLEWVLYKNLEPGAARSSPTATRTIAVAVLDRHRRHGHAREVEHLLSDRGSARARTTPTPSGKAPRTRTSTPSRFADSTDTIYITSPEEYQALCAPLIVGVLEQIRHAVYRRSRRTRDPRATDDCGSSTRSRTSPRSTTCPSLLSQAGGQRLQVVAGLQDLTQARERWGEHAADGFMIAVPDQADPQRHRRLEDAGVHLPRPRRIRPRSRQPVPRPLRPTRVPRLAHRTATTSATRPSASGSSPRARSRRLPRGTRPPAARQRLGTCPPHQLVRQRAMADDRRARRAMSRPRDPRTPSPTSPTSSPSETSTRSSSPPTPCAASWSACNLTCPAPARSPRRWPRSKTSAPATAPAPSRCS